MLAVEVGVALVSCRWCECSFSSWFVVNWLLGAVALCFPVSLLGGCRFDLIGSRNEEDAVCTESVWERRRKDAGARSKKEGLLLFHMWRLCCYSFLSYTGIWFYLPLFWQRRELSLCYEAWFLFWLMITTWTVIIYLDRKIRCLDLGADICVWPEKIQLVRNEIWSKFQVFLSLFFPYTSWFCL